MDPRDRHVGLHWQPASEVENRATGEDPTGFGLHELTNSLGTPGPDEPVRDCAVTSPSAFLRHRRCQRSSRYDDGDVPVQIAGYNLP